MLRTSGAILRNILLYDIIPVVTPLSTAITGTSLGYPLLRPLTRLPLTYLQSPDIRGENGEEGKGKSVYDI